MCKTKLIINVIIALTLVLTAMGSVTTPVQAGNGNDELKADPRLLQMAEENPKAVFMVIVQKEVKYKDLNETDPEVDAESEGGKVKKQFKVIESFSAELTGKQILKLAKKKKVRWISADAPMVSTAAGEQAPVNSIAMTAPLAAIGTVYTVTNTNNSGTGTLRQAITDANAHAGADTISFNISGTGAHTITPTSALPTITGAVILDATTDNSFAANGNMPAIILDGNNLSADGLKLSSTADGTTIRGLVIRDFTGDGIEIQSGSNGNTVTGNYIGRLTATGTDAGSGEANGGQGINLLGANNTIGGLTAADRNVISGNNNGVKLNGTSATGNLVLGNYIGTNAAGSAAIGNSDDGVALNAGASNNTIGGSTASARNVISGNLDDGVDLDNSTTTGNIFRGNYIGTDATGALALANSNNGFDVASDANTFVIGGAGPGDGNLIAFNGQNGVMVSTPGATGIAILGNSIFGNASLGIDLGNNGFTTNNGTKSSSLSNYGMDYPVITAASLGGGILNVTGYVGSAASQSTFANARVEFFKSAADSSGYGEGQTFVGYLTSDASGNFNGSLPGTGLTTSDKLTATATDGNNNTSEFGPNFQVTTATSSVVPSPYTSVVHADQLWGALTGQGVTVAVIDSGVSSFHPDLMTGGNSRIIASEKFGDYVFTPEDLYGHGTHVAGIIGGNGSASDGTYKGMAPDVNLINLKTTDEFGMTYESDVVDAMQWVYDNKDTYNIRVVNLSMNSTVAQSYHTSPLCAAVEILWFNGIVVVVSAGNNGTADGPSTIYPPANDPFVITVGASEDKGTASLTDDTMAVFSAYGTTIDGFAKPDLVAPGRNIVAPLGGLLNIVFQLHPLHRVNDYYFRMSGTSMSAPVVTGAVALLLQDEPNLNPDQVKYRLKATANTTWSGYSASQSGAGHLDIFAAVNGTSTETANTGIFASQMLSTGSEPITWGSAGWNSAGWNTAGWNSAGWNTAGWNTAGWNTAGWNTSTWDD